MNYDYILQAILDIGEEMVVSGAEVSRVEDSITRMCESYGATRVNVFIITSNIQVTMEAPDRQIHTHIRRIVGYDVNFDRLDYLNDLSRFVCRHTPAADVILEKLDEVLERPQQNRLLRVIGSMLVAGGFAVFFGGSMKDAFASLILGAVIAFIEIVLARYEKNQIVYNFLTSVVSGFTAIALVRFNIGQDQGIVMIAGIMLLIPGIAMTNAVRDMLIGDIAAGTLRLVNALLVATAIACGFVLSILMTGGAV